MQILICNSGEEKVTLTGKVTIPVEEKPDFNWVGRIIGPGGVTLRSLENKSGCKVSLRGKGSVRDSEVMGGGGEGGRIIGPGERGDYGRARCSETSPST